MFSREASSWDLLWKDFNPEELAKVLRPADMTTWALGLVWEDSGSGEGLLAQGGAYSLPDRNGGLVLP